MSRRVPASNSRSYPWSGLDPDRRNAILLVSGICAILVLAFAILAYGYYQDRVAPGRDTIITVGNTKIDYEAVERRASAELLRGRIDPADLTQAILDIVILIEREETLRQSAKDRGINLTEEEIHARTRERLALATDVTEQQYAARYRGELLRLGLTYNEYRDIVKSELVERKLREEFGAEVPAETEHVNLRLLETSTKEDAEKARQRLENGENFTLVAFEMSTDASKENGGQFGWTPRGAARKEIEDVAFALTPGVNSSILELDTGFFILAIEGKEMRPVTEDGKNSIVRQSIDNVLTEKRNEVGSQLTMTQEQLQQLAFAISGTVG